MDYKKRELGLYFEEKALSLKRGWVGRGQRGARKWKEKCGYWEEGKASHKDRLFFIYAVAGRRKFRQ